MQINWFHETLQPPKKNLEVDGFSHISEVDGFHQVFGSHVHEQLPQGLVFVPRPQVPKGVDDCCHCEVNHSFLWTNLHTKK